MTHHANFDELITTLAQGNDITGGYAGVELIERAQQSADAVRLVELGARAPLVQHLTGLAKKTVNRLCRQLTGRPSSQGSTTYTDNWFVDDVHRMLQAAVIWALYQRHPISGSSPARVLINVYEAYQSLYRTPLLSLHRAHFVLTMMATGDWRARTCKDCKTRYLAPLDCRDTLCPGCRLYYQYRCYRCGAAITVHARGRRRKTCKDCSMDHR